MAWVGIRTGMSKILVTPKSGTAKPLLKINLQGIFPVQAAAISGSALRDTVRERPKPYPYKSVKYNFWRAWLQDTTTWRFDENTKVIVVEGPPAAGKTEFAKVLAKDLDMEYFPAVTMDDMYINAYGYDMRKLDPELPPHCKSYDEKDFCRDPGHWNASRFQVQKYSLRYAKYIDALAHLLNTGQGVVLTRCVYSDFVFMEAMAKSGFISNGVRDAYLDIKANTIGVLMKPHLVIYLDIPVPVIQQRIKERNLPHEQNSKVYSTEFLSNLEYFYKQMYLKQISEHAELLVYDWTEYGEAEVVVEDIERIDFDSFDKHDPKLKDWRLADEWHWNYARIRYTNEKPELLSLFNCPHFDVPELVYNPEEVQILRTKWFSAPGNNYQKEFNLDMGDKNLLFKNKARDYRVP